MKKLIIVSLVSIMGSCTSSTPSAPVEQNVSNDTTYSYSCPFLTKDGNGNVAMSWVKELNDSDAILCYAMIDERTNSFKTVHEIAPSKGLNPHGENLPKIAFKKDGTIIAMWGIANPNPNNRFSGLVRYAVSRDGTNWDEPLPLVPDTTSYDQRYFDMVLLPDGEIGTVWLDSRLKEGEEGSTLFFAKTDTKSQFIEERSIARTCCPCCRTDLFIGKNQDIHVAFRDIIQDSIRDMVHLVSRDKGKSFSQPVRIAADNWVINGCPHTGPSIAENEVGLHFAWYTLGTGEGVFYGNTKDGEHFSPKDNVSSNASAKHPQIIASKDKLFIVWDETVRYDSSMNNAVMLQIRDKEGNRLEHKNLTSFSKISAFPVLIENPSGSVLIAYTVQQGERKQVCYTNFNQ